ncbi:MAG: DUF4959 domain-containing protein [Pedobacter sp.]|nr:MAG: DUF4959 domain-containing protein [Pedobacter sp.]
MVITNMILKIYSMKNLLYIITALLAIGIYGCQKGGRLEFSDADAPAPGQVTNVKAVSNPGGAILTYKIPVDPNISYVKAVYEIRPGVLREAKSSTYTDTLSLVGFGDTNPHEVKIYSVGNNEKASEPVIITITPLMPPVKSIFGTVDLSSIFGGVSVSFSNNSKANISVELMVDSSGMSTWAPLYTYYSAAAVGKFSVRGLKSAEKKFAVLLRDRWNNTSDTLFRTLTPRFEVQIPKNTWSILKLPGDLTASVDAGFPIAKLFDGKWAVIGDSFATPNGSPLPQWFTIDLGKKVSMSRFKEHQSPTSHLYVGSAEVESGV